MKKFLTIIILLTISSSLFSQNLFLNKKPYYKSLFTLKDINQLDAAFLQRDKASKFLDKSDNFLDKATVYQKKAQLPIASSKVKRFNRKSLKYKKKAAKYEIKGDKIILDANNVIKQIYLQNLKTYKPDKKVKPIISALQLNAKKYLDSSSIAKAKIAATTDNIQKSHYFNDATFFDQKALLNMEYQFAVQAEDKDIIKMLSKKYAPNKQQAKKDSLAKIPFDPSKDKYLFYSKNLRIDEIINYNAAEENLITQYYNLGKNAYLSMKKANRFNDTINKLSEKIKATSDFMAKREIIQKKREVQNQQTYTKIEALKKYISANNNYYNARKNHIKDYMPNDTASEIYKKANIYVKKSDDFFKDSQELLAKSDLKSGEEKYKTVLASNDQILTALEYQENAFNIMFGNDTQKVIVKHKLIKEEQTNKNSTNTGKNNNKKNTTKKNGKKTGKNKSKTHKISVNQINGLFVYSYENPTPHRASTPSGVIYRVQVGHSKYILPVNELREYDKIYFETHKGTNVKNFLVGDYRSYSEAKKTLAHLKSKGYTDAYIVKYVDGKRQGAKYYANYKPVVNQYNKNYNAIDITKTKYLVYFVQIGTFSEAKTQKELKNLSKLYYRKLADGRIQYFVGPYYRYDIAKKKLGMIKQKGFNDAIVAAFNNGEKISLDRARKIEQNVKSASNIVFSVQVGVFSDYLPQKKFDEKFGKIKGIYKISTHKQNGLIIYTVGNARTFTEAKKIRKNIANLGFTDSFIVAFKGGKKIPLSEALK